MSQSHCVLFISFPSLLLVSPLALSQFTTRFLTWEHCVPTTVSPPENKTEAQMPASTYWRNLLLAHDFQCSLRSRAIHTGAPKFLKWGFDSNNAKFHPRIFYKTRIFVLEAQHSGPIYHLAFSSGDSQVPKYSTFCGGKLSVMLPAFRKNSSSETKIILPERLPIYYH